MKTRLLILLLLLSGATLLQAKTVNKIVFKRSISGPVKLKDSGGRWYTVTNGASFTGEYNFIRGYDGECNGLSVRHKGEYSRPGDNRSDFIRTWYVGESVMPYLNDSYHDCPNAKSSSSSSSSSNNSYSSNRSSSSSSSSNRSSYSNSSQSPTTEYDHMIDSWPDDCEMCGNWKGSYQTTAIVPKPNDPGSNMFTTVTAYVVLGIGNEDNEYVIKNVDIGGLDPSEGTLRPEAHITHTDDQTIEWYHYYGTDYDWDSKYKGRWIGHSEIRLICAVKLQNGVLEYTSWPQTTYYDRNGKLIGAETYDDVPIGFKKKVTLHRIQ